MNPKFRRIAVFVGAAALAAGAGIGVASYGNSGEASSTPGISRPAQGGPLRGDLSSLAAELGVSESRLQAAMAATRPNGGPPGSSDLAEALASELGLSADKVREALEAARPAGGGDGGRGGGIPGGGAPPDGTSPDGTSPDGSSPGSSSLS